MAPTFEVLSQSDVQKNAMRALRMSGSLDQVHMTSPEVLGALTRRAAGVLCPCPERTIREELKRAMRGLEEEEAGAKTGEMIQELITIGDLQELSVSQNDRSRRMLYATPPSFVLREGDLHVILGIASDGQQILPETFRDQIECQGPVRFFRANREEAARVFESQGLTRVTDEEWLDLPNIVSSENEYINCFVKALERASRVRSEVEGVKILDPDEPPQFYTGRWRELRSSDEGRYVARRAQRFGSDLWSYVEVREGSVHRLVDLPLFKSTNAPNDEAWRLQAAIDSQNGSPQVYRSRSDRGEKLLDVFSPLPSWAKRRFSVVGDRMSGEQGAIRTYRFSGDVSEEKAFLEQHLWMRDESEE